MAGHFRQPQAVPSHLAAEPSAAMPPDKILAPGTEHRPFSDEEIKLAFDTFDLDKNHFVGAMEIRHILGLIGEEATDDEIDEMIRMCDSDGDGQVTFDEFSKLMATPQPAPGAAAAQAAAASPPVSPPSSSRKGVASINVEPPPRPASDPNDFDSKSGMGSLVKHLSGGAKMKPTMIKKIYRKFESIDTDGSGNIDYQEFLAVLEMEDCFNSKQLFRLFDVDGNGTVSLKEFIVVLSKYTSSSKTEKLKFAFMMFDEDGSGFIDRNELTRMLQANFMTEGFTPAQFQERAAEVYKDLKIPFGTKISYENFMALSVSKNGLLFPLTSLARTMDKELSLNKLVNNKDEDGNG